MQAQIVDMSRNYAANGDGGHLDLPRPGIVGRTGRSCDRYVRLLIVEEAPVKELYRAPGHPYTKGLLGSLPRLDANERERLASIEGIPPVLYRKASTCPFAPRCP